MLCWNIILKIIGVAFSILPLSNMRRRLMHSALGNKVRPVVPFVGPEGDAMVAGYFRNHVNGGFLFGLAPDFCYPGIHHQTVSLLHQRMAHITKPCLLPLTYTQL